MASLVPIHDGIHDGIPELELIHDGILDQELIHDGILDQELIHDGIPEQELEHGLNQHYHEQNLACYDFEGLEQDLCVLSSEKCLDLGVVIDDFELVLSSEELQPANMPEINKKLFSFYGLEYKNCFSNYW